MNKYLAVAIVAFAIISLEALFIVTIDEPTGEQNKKSTKTAIPIITVTPIVTTTTVMIEDYDGIFKDETFLHVSGYQIVSGNFNGKYVKFVGKIFNVLQRQLNNDYGREFIDFQVWSSPFSNKDPIYITVPTDSINGTIRDDMIVEVYGFVNKVWMKGQNSVGGTISQPLIFAINVTVIAESPR